MARFTTNFTSRALYRAITLDIIVPSDHMCLPGKDMPDAKKPFKTMYYLEGALGNCSGPLNYSTLQRVAEDYNMAVVCIGGENKWFGNSVKTGDNLIDMVAKDVVNFTRKTFHFSDKREDTYIAGFSMGGHAAFVIGLRNPDIFGRIISIDASFQKGAILTAVEAGQETWDISSKSAYESMFGLDDVNDWVGSDQDYEKLARDLARDNKDLMPKALMLCGTEDALYAPNKEYYELLKEAGYDAQWIDLEGGNHSYYTCDMAFEPIMKWLPIDEKETFCNNYPYNGKDAFVSIDNFNNWEAFYNIK